MGRALPGPYLYWPKRTAGSPREWLQHWPGGPHGHHRPNGTQLRLSEAHVRMRYTAATRRRKHRKGKVVLRRFFFNVSYINIFFSYTKRKRNNSRLTEPQALVTPPSGSRLLGGLTESHPLADWTPVMGRANPPPPSTASSGCALPGMAHQSSYRSWCQKFGPCRLCQLLSNHLQRPPRRRAPSYCSWRGGVVSEQWAYRDVYRGGHPSGSVAVLLSG